MAPPLRAQVTEESLRGFKYFRLLRRLLKRLHKVGADKVVSQEFRKVCGAFICIEQLERNLIFPCRDPAH
jgi:hypothetical protein